MCITHIVECYRATATQRHTMLAVPMDSEKENNDFCVYCKHQPLEKQRCEKNRTEKKNMSTLHTGKAKEVMRACSNSKEMLDSYLHATQSAQLFRNAGTQPWEASGTRNNVKIRRRPIK